METKPDVDNAVIKAISEPLAKSRFWIKLAGILMIIQGVMAALSITGLIVAWLPIWLGVLLFQSAIHIERAFNHNDLEALAAAMNKLKSYFTITGILYLLVVIILFVVMMFGDITSIGQLPTTEN